MNSYVHPSHVEYAETAGPHPTREQILEQQKAAAHRRRRARIARALTGRKRRD